MLALGMALSALGWLAACSQDSRTDRSVGTSTSGSASSAVSGVAGCRPTRGEPTQGHAFGSTRALRSFAKLHPGSAVTADEAAAETSARQGTPLIIAGTVYAADCKTVLAGALIDVWQTDTRGEYGPGHGTENLRCCYLLGTLKTNSRGQYQIETVRPGHYRGAHPPPPAHIHFNVLYPGKRGITTELDFAGDPYLTREGRETEVTTLHRETGADGTPLRARFDIVLAPS